MIDKKIFDLLERGARLEAYELLVDTYHSALIRHADNWLYKYEVPWTADEVVSDTLAKFITMEIHRDIRRLLPYLKSMIRYRIHHEAWRRSRLAELPPGVKGYSALEEEVVRRDEAERLEREIVVTSDLSSNQLDSLVLRHKYDVPIPLIAAALDLKPSSVPVLISNAKKRLRQQFGQDYTPQPITELDELVYKLHQSHLKCVMMYAKLLEKKENTLPIEVIRERANLLLKEVGFYS